jgi:cytochrome c peroxidase
MIDRRYLVAAGLVAAGAALWWAAGTPDGDRMGEVDTVAVPAPSARGAEPISPLPETSPLPAGRVTLGERLFRDPQLSRDRTIACISCHDLEHGGVDGRRFSVGIGGATGTINAPTVFNARFNFVQFWDGRAASLEEQAAGPIHNPIEMDSNWDQVLARLRADPEYPRSFAANYRDGITAGNVADAIATFERTLVTPNARFDRYLRGEEGALNADELEGYRRFKAFGCTSCHQGTHVGGNLFQRFGVMRDYFADRPLNDTDQGRYNVTRREEDRHVFKVPSLRNVAVTAPYFHDGSAKSLDDAITIMGRYQLGRELSAEDRRLIAAFLRSLTGEWQGKPLQ